MSASSAIEAPPRALSEKPIAVVTGAAGFIGRHVASELNSRGYLVFALGLSPWTTQTPEQWGVSRWMQGGVTAHSINELVDGSVPTCYIHCAGGSAVSASYADPGIDFSNSAVSTSVVLNHARQQSPHARVVICSSAAVYGQQGDVDLSETTPRAPISPYGVHKLTAELLCESYSKFFNVRTTIVRLFSVYGEGLKKQLLWDAVQKLSAGKSVFYGTGREIRDWIHVLDASRLLCDAAELKSDQSHVYNGANQQASIRRVLTTLSELSGCEPMQLRFSGEVHPGNPLRLTSCPSLASRELKWRPVIDLEAGLRRYVEWFRSWQQRT